MTKRQLQVLREAQHLDAVRPDRLLWRGPLGWPALSILDALVSVGALVCISRGQGTDPAYFRLTDAGRAIDTEPPR